VLRLLFQNLIMEERLDTRTVTLKTWRLALSRLQGLQPRLLHVISPLIRDWFTLLMTPIGVPIQTSLLYQHMPIGAEEGHNVDKSMIAQDLSLVSTETIVRARVAGSRALAIVLACWPVQEQNDAFGVPLEFYQESTSMLQQFLAATIVREWASEFCAQSRPLPTQSLRATSPLADKMVQRFFAYLQADPPPSYYEMYLNLSHISSNCRALLDMFQRDAKVPPARIPALPTTIDTNGTIEGAFSISMARDIVESTFVELCSHVPRAKRKELPSINAKQREIAASILQYGEIKGKHDARVSAAVAGALIALREMPSKLNPVIRSVMNGVKVGYLIDSSDIARPQAEP
jgi:TATA-binding protein-associated factor